MRKYLALFLAAFVFFSGGCTVKNGGAPTQMQVEAKRDQLTELSSSKTVSIVGQPYLGAKPIVRESGEEIPVLGKNVTLKQIEEEDADKKVEAIRVNMERHLSELEKKYNDNKDKWVNEIVQNIIGR